MRAPGFRTDEFISVVLTPGEAKKDMIIRLDAARDLDVVVLGADGQPVSGAYVIEDSDAYSFRPSRGKARRTDSSGGVHLASMPSRALTLWAWQSGHAAGKVDIAAGADTSKPFAIQLTQGGTVECMVTIDGKPARGVALFGGVRDGLSNEIDGITDQEGRLVYPNLAAGLVSVSATIRPEPAQGGGRTAQRSIKRVGQIRAGETTRLVFDFAGTAAALEGSISLRGAAPKSCQIVAFITTSDGTVERAEPGDRVGADGTYRFGELPAGKVQVVASGFGEGDSDTRCSRYLEFDLPAGPATVTNIALSGTGKIVGQVSGLRGNRAMCIVVPPAVTVGTDENSISDLSEDCLMFVQVTPNGSFEITGLESGAYKLIAFDTQESGRDPDHYGVTTAQVGADTPAHVTLSVP